MNTAAGESYQDRVRYYRQQAEQARANKSRQKMEPKRAQKSIR